MPRYIPLTPDQFASRRWARYRDHRHLADQHWAPIAAPEVAKAAAHLPLAFVRPGEGKAAQLGALLGLKPGVNHCLSTEYRWQVGYTPALYRTHPFRVLPTQAGGTQRTLCVDADSPWLGASATEPFFTDNGELAPRVKEVLDYLMTLEKHLYRTQKAVDSLDDLGLLVPLSLRSVEGGSISGVLQVDETALNQLTDDTWLSLRKSGGAAIAYAQLISLGQLPFLRQRALISGGYAPEALDDLDAFFGDDGDELRFDFDD